MSEAQTPVKFEVAIQALTQKGWRVVSDGPTGVQMEAPKEMDIKDRVIAALGAVMILLFWPLGVLLITVALLDYAVFTKPRQKFFPRW